MRRLARKAERPLNGAALVLSLGVILYITVFSRAPVLIRSVQMVPFSSLKDALLGDVRTGLQIAANVALFIPFGYGLRRIPQAALASLLLSAGVELMQYYWILGLASADDVLANLIGGVLGAGLYTAIGGCKEPEGYRPACLSSCSRAGCWAAGSGRRRSRKSMKTNSPFRRRRSPQKR